MPFRDVALTIVIFSLLPACFARPWIGVLVWYWIGMMNPHRLTWGFAYDTPFALIVAIVTLSGFLFTKDRAPLPKTRETYLLIGLWGLFTASTVFALYPSLAWPMWWKVTKTLVFVCLMLLVCQDRVRMHYLFLVIALSIGFYGLKGGIFALLTGGQFEVRYPEETSMGSNTGLGMALDMTIPILFFLPNVVENVALRRLLRVTLVFCIPATVFTYSRGALLGLAAVVAVLGVKAKRKVLTATAIAVAAVFVLNFAPDQWMARMETIKTYEEDMSARMRLESYRVFYQVGLARPILGAGFWGPAQDEVYFRYAPGAWRSNNAHNSFLNILGEHGVIAFGLFLTLLLSCWLTLRRIRKPRGGRPAPAWVLNYSHMLEVSLLGYIVNSFFQSAAYLEFFYLLIGLTIVLETLADREASGTAFGRPLSRSTNSTTIPNHHVRHSWAR